MPKRGTAAGSRGLSPRVRGNRSCDLGWLFTRGSIPACAGEPGVCGKCGDAATVYPRVCGGTREKAAKKRFTSGLSPRVRGNPAGAPAGIPPPRSIPACAGEPGVGVTGIWKREVYPRVCGGTRCRPSASAPKSGLSPRVRGNHPLVNGRLRRRRSIPACAGEPAGVSPHMPPSTVYPRVCGGTVPVRFGTSFYRGLSPRVRGNRFRRLGTSSGSRSIPACAGEPANHPTKRNTPKVYPRVCGGTAGKLIINRNASGLSPRVRGNRTRRTPRKTGSRSIPACEGEPRPSWCPSRG